MARTSEDGAAGISRRAVAAALTAVVLAFGAGAFLLGFDGERAAPPPAATTAALAAGCTEQPLRFTVTNDQREVDRQLAFERAYQRGASELPPVGFHTAALDPTASLHAASHSWVVVYYDAALRGDRLDRLRALFAEIGEQKIPALASPRSQTAGLVAVRNGAELTCEQAGPAQVEQVRRFTAALYPSLGA